MSKKMCNQYRNIFTGFGIGDFSAVLDTIAEDVDWQSQVTRSIKKELPWSKPRYSRQFTAKDDKSNRGRKEQWKGKIHWQCLWT